MTKIVIIRPMLGFVILKIKNLNFKFFNKKNVQKTFIFYKLKILIV